MKTKVALPLAAMMLAAWSGAAAAETTIRFAHMNSPSHPVNEGGKQMAAAVAERTGGEIKIELYPSGQLGENSQVTEQISLGGDIIGQVGVGTIADYVPDFSIIIYPFLYPDYDAAKTFLKSDLIKDLEQQAAEKANARVLCYLHFGVRDLYTRDKEVRGPEIQRASASGFSRSPCIPKWSKRSLAAPRPRCPGPRPIAHWPRA